MKPLVREAWAILVKDLRSELRTRAALLTILLFSSVALILVAFTVRLQGDGLTRVISTSATTGRAVPMAVPEGTELLHQLLAALLWVVLFFATMSGLPRGFVKEVESGTIHGLRLMARSTAVLLGKLALNMVLALLVVVVVTPLYMFLIQPPVANWGALMAVLGGGNLALAAGATLVGAMVARAGGKAYLMFALAFPVLLPILLIVINGTAEATQGKSGNWLWGIGSYWLLATTLAVLLFPYVWEDE